MERAITRPLWGREREIPWAWYSEWTKLPKSPDKAQTWIWKSAQAYQDFSRRRLRMLVARNTAVAFLLLTVGWQFVAPFSLGQTVLGSLAFALFAWLWLDAQKGWNIAVNNAKKIGKP
jgi:hypothetical protein